MLLIICTLLAVTFCACKGAGKDGKYAPALLPPQNESDTTDGEKADGGNTNGAVVDIVDEILLPDSSAGDYEEAGDVSGSGNTATGGQNSSGEQFGAQSGTTSGMQSGEQSGTQSGEQSGTTPGENAGDITDKTQNPDSKEDTKPVNPFDKDGDGYIDGWH